MDIARILWDIGPASVRQVHELASQTREIDFATVQTYLRRLESKGYASSKLNARQRIYSAKAKPQTVIRDTVDELVNRLFGGRTMPLVRHLIEAGDIQPNDIIELRQLIDDLESAQSVEPTPRKDPQS